MIYYTCLLVLHFCVVGFFVAPLVSRFGLSTVTVISGLLSFLGLAATAVSTDITFLIITYGVVTGEIKAERMMS